MQVYEEVGFHPEALAMRDRQEKVYQDLIDAGFYSPTYDDDEAVQAACKPLLGQYELNIEEARQSGLINTAHAACIDPMSYETYHNVYKSDVGIRPRGFITYAGMHLWLEQRP